MADGRRGQSKRARSAGPRRRRPRFDVVGLGALNLDRLYAVPELVRDGGVEVTASTTQPGGSAANTIYGLARLGLRCGFVGVVGEDDAGNALLRSFREVGVDTTGIVVRRGAATGETICITAGHTQKAIYIMPGANSLLDSRGIDLAYVSDTRHVHLSSFVGESVFSQQSRVVEQLPAEVGISLALDSVYARRGLDAMSGLIRRCALLFANTEELRKLTAEQELLSAARACLDAGCRTVVATFGSSSEPRSAQASSRLPETTATMIVTRRTAGRGPEIIEHTVPAVRVHDGAIVDTTGAGDAFAAGFLFGLLSRRYGPAKCGALGHTAAGFSLTQLGARRGLPTRHDLLARFDDRFRSLFGRERKTNRPLNPARTG